MTTPPPLRMKIQTVRDAGLSLEAIATHVGTSKRTVQRVAKEAVIADPAAVDAKRDLGRPSKVTPIADAIARAVTRM